MNAVGPNSGKVRSASLGQLLSGDSPDVFSVFFLSTAPFSGLCQWPNRLYVMVVGVSVFALLVGVLHASRGPAVMIGHDVPVTVMYLCWHVAMLASTY